MLRKTWSGAVVNVVGRKKKEETFFTPEVQNVWQNIVNI